MNKLITALLCLFIPVLLNSCGKDEEPEPRDNTPVFEPINFGSATFGSVTDAEGNTYKTVVIGDATWMAENLRATKFQNGDAIAKVAEGTAWLDAKDAAYFNYRDDADMISLYGRIYNASVKEDERNICPSGWHIPSVNEWTDVEKTLNPDPGNKMKETGTAHWVNKNESTNDSGFTGMPGGSLHKGNLTDVGTDGYWWSSSVGDFFYLTNTSSALRTKPSVAAEAGMAIRCVKD